MKTKTVKQLPYKLLAILLLLPLASCQEIRQVKVTVTEENNTPIEAANVSVDFLGCQGSDDHKVKGTTNAQGILITNGAAELDIQARISKEGYYETYLPRLGRSKDHDLTCVLRKKINPIGLYAKRLQTIAPAADKDFHYDCMIGDWVKPYGKGKVSDFIFTARKIRQVNLYKDYHYELTLKFSNSKDGFVKFDLDGFSQLKSPHTAPDFDDYKKIFHYFKKRQPGKGAETNAETNRGYFFRLRTQVDENDEIVYCHYAKAYGDIPDMNIYFNPTPNDRNLEFDPTKNLFQNLGTSEQVHEP